MKPDGHAKNLSNLSNRLSQKIQIPTVRLFLLFTVVVFFTVFMWMIFGTRSTTSADTEGGISKPDDHDHEDDDKSIDVDVNMNPSEDMDMKKHLPHLVDHQVRDLNHYSFKTQYFNFNQSLSTRFCNAIPDRSKRPQFCAYLAEEKLMTLPHIAMMDAGPIVSIGVDAGTSESWGIFVCTAICKVWQSLGAPEVYVRDTSDYLLDIVGHVDRVSDRWGDWQTFLDQADRDRTVIMLPEGWGGQHNDFSNTEWRVVSMLLGWGCNWINANAVSMPTQNKYAEMCYLPTLHSSFVPVKMKHYNSAFRNDSWVATKENIVLIDDDANCNGIAMEAYLRQFPKLENATVYKIGDISHDDMVHLYERAKVVVDTDSIAAEGINLEGVMYDCLGVVTMNKAASDHQDVPMPIVNKAESHAHLFETVRDALLEYEERIPLMHHLKTYMKNNPSIVLRDQGIYYGSRGLLFVTMVRTYSERRSLLPWLLSVMSMYPLARIEVFVPNVNFMWLDLAALYGDWSPVMRNRLPPLFVKFRDYPADEMAGVDNLGSWAIMGLKLETRGARHIVFSDVSSVFLDIVAMNEHAKALNESGTCMVGSTQSPFIFVQADPFNSFVHPNGSDGDGKKPDMKDANAFVSSVGAACGVYKDGDKLPVDVLQMMNPARYQLPEDNYVDKVSVPRQIKPEVLWDPSVVLTHAWSKRLCDLNYEEYKAITEAADPLVHSPLWMSTQMFMPQPYRKLATLFRPDEFDLRGTLDN